MDDGRMDMVYLNIKSAGEWYIFSEGLQTSTASKHRPPQKIDSTETSIMPNNHV